MSTQKIRIETPFGRISQRLFSIVFSGALAATLAACGGTESDVSEEPEAPVETTEQGIKITCRQAERQYDAICYQYGNQSQQCSMAYDVLHCFCQNCAS